MTQSNQITSSEPALNGPDSGHSVHTSTSPAATPPSAAMAAGGVPGFDPSSLAIARLPRATTGELRGDPATSAVEAVRAETTTAHDPRRCSPNVRMSSATAAAALVPVLRAP